MNVTAPVLAAPAPSRTTTRRSLLGAVAAAGLASALAAAGARTADASQDTQLPPAQPDPDDPFAVDLNVNMETIDDYLGIPGVCYRDMRMVKDPADYAAIGGDAVLSVGIEGFKAVPFPYVANLPELPVDGAYDGPHLFDVAWGEGTEVLDARPRYEESELIVGDLFPRDRPIVLCCGGGGYAAMMRSLLLWMGYDPGLLYNAGGVWDYTGYRAVELARHDEKTGETKFFLWRADITVLDFSQLTEMDLGVGAGPGTDARPDSDANPGGRAGSQA